MIARARTSLVKEALGLVYRQYLEAGLCEPNPYGQRWLPCHDRLDTEVLVDINEGGGVNATVTLVTSRPLPIERVADPPENSCEACCLASRGTAMWRLFRYVVQRSGELGFERVVAAILPEHVAIYKRMGFWEFANPVQLPYARNRTVTPMSLEV